MDQHTCLTRISVNNSETVIFLEQRWISSISDSVTETRGRVREGVGRWPGRHWGLCWTCQRGLALPFADSQSGPTGFIRTMVFYVFLMSATDSLTDITVQNRSHWQGKTSGGHRPNDLVQHRYHSPSLITTDHRNVKCRWLDMGYIWLYGYMIWLCNCPEEVKRIISCSGIYENY